MTTDDLNKQFRKALQTADLAIELDRNLLGGHALLRLTGPGATARSKRVPLVPVIVGEKGESHADLLEQLARAMKQARG